MKSILITGGAGFVGRNMIRHIRRTMDGVSIAVVDDFSEDRASFWKQGLDRVVDSIHEGDVRHRLPWASAPFDLCIHLAAVVGGRLKIENAAAKIATENVSIDATVIGAVSQGLAHELIYFSSSAAYPVIFQRRGNGMLLSEEMVDFQGSIGSPDATYGWAKVNGEFLVRTLKDVPYTIVRPFSGYGSDQLDSYPFPAIMGRIVARENPITVWGSGDQTRDWVHIDDVCRMVLELHERRPCGVWNVGTGIGTAFKELATKAMTLAGRAATVACDESKPEGVFYRVADVRKAQAVGVAATISLDAGVNRWLADNRSQ